MKDLKKAETDRYDRQITLPEVGVRGQQRLKNARVLVIGAGGLGTPCAMYLASMGLGTLTVVDFDRVSISNLPRQPLYNAGDVSKNKATILCKRITDQNPNVNATAILEAFSIENALELVKTHNIVIDCTDNLETRYLINDVCVQVDKPFVSAGVYRFEGQLGVFNFKGGPTYRCYFPEPDNPALVASCEDNGILATVPGIFGLYQAMEVVKMIVETGIIRNNNIMISNLLTNFTYTIKGERNQRAIDRAFMRFSGHSDIEPLTITIHDLLSGHQDIETVWVDVRDANELPRLNATDIIQVPLSKVTSYLPPDKSRIILFCASGKRSRIAAEILCQRGYKNIYYCRESPEEIIRSGLLHPIST